MQEFELLLIIISTIYLVFNRRINEKIIRPYVLVPLALVFILHLIFEGLRWQMIPAYLIFLLALITVYKRSEKDSSTFVKLFRGIGLATLLALAITLPSIFPVFELPDPTGEYIVGTKDIYMELDREEVITADSIDKRSFMIKVWYPSKETGGEMDPYIDQAGRIGFANKYGLPDFMFDYLDKVETNVYREISITEESFPVLVFSHGYNSKANGYYALLSEIVSHGYIVFAINHTYESTGSTFPDGEYRYFDYDYANKIQTDTWHQMEPVIEAFDSELSFEERHPIVRKGLANYFVRDMVERWAEDIIDVVDEMGEWNKSGFFKGKMDLENIGVFGHSRGGGAAGEALLRDNDIKVGANIDGVQWGQIVDTAFQKPFLFLAADWPEDHENLNQHAYVNKSTSVFYEGMVHQTLHSNFMDIPYMIPLNALSEAGEIDPDLAMMITTSVLTSFFDRHLKDKDVDMQALAKKYDKLDLKEIRGDAKTADAN